MFPIRFREAQFGSPIQVGLNCSLLVLRLITRVRSTSERSAPPRARDCTVAASTPCGQPFANGCGCSTSDAMLYIHSDQSYSAVQPTAAMFLKMLALRAIGIPCLRTSARRLLTVPRSLPHRSLSSTEVSVMMTVLPTALLLILVDQLLPPWRFRRHRRQHSGS